MVVNNAYLVFFYRYTYVQQHSNKNNEKSHFDSYYGFNDISNESEKNVWICLILFMQSSWLYIRCLLTSEMLVWIILFICFSLKLLKAAGLNVTLEDVANADHFSIIEQLVEEEYYLTKVKSISVDF